MRKIVVISGGLRVPSSSLNLAEDLAAATRRAFEARGEQAETEIVHLRDHAHAIIDNMLTGFPSGEFAEVMERVLAADGLIVVSPTFSAGMSGLFKSFFDVVEMEKLAGMPVLMAATGGTDRHSLVIEYAMRPLFTYMKAIPVGTGIYAATQDFGGEGTQRLAARVERAAAEFVNVIGVVPEREAVDEFENVVDFSTLLGK